MLGAWRANNPTPTISIGFSKIYRIIFKLPLALSKMSCYCYLYRIFRQLHIVILIKRGRGTGPMKPQQPAAIPAAKVLIPASFYT